MKNSNSFLLAALLVLLASLTAYNMALRAEYRSGAYKNALRDFTALNFKNFDEVAVPGASTVSVKIVAGPYAVHLHPAVAGYVHLRQQGGQLVVETSFAGRREYNFNDGVVISCPRLAALRTDAVYQEAGRRLVDKQNAMGQRVVVQGFRQDSLRVWADHASRVELQGNQLGHLQAVAGPSPGSRTTLQVNADNHLAAADFTLDHQSELQLANTAIPQLRHHFGDSAKVTLSGAALGSVLK